MQGAIQVLGFTLQTDVHRHRDTDSHGLPILQIYKIWTNTFLEILVHIFGKMVPVPSFSIILIGIIGVILNLTLTSWILIWLTLKMQSVPPCPQIYHW